MRKVDYASQIQESVEELKRQEDTITSARIHKRVQLLRLLKSRQVRFFKEACQIVGFSDVWGRELLQKYLEQGLEKYLEMNYTHRKTGKLTAEQETLVNLKAHEGFDSQAEVSQWVVAEFGIQLSATSVSRLLQRLEITAKVPRPRNRKTSSEEQEGYKKNLRDR